MFQEQNTVPQSAYVSIIGSNVYNKHNNHNENDTQTIIMQQYRSRMGDNEDIDNNSMEDDPEERKETEQMPLTRDLLGSTQKFKLESPNRICRGAEDSDDMIGDDVEFSDFEKTLA